MQPSISIIIPIYSDQEKIGPTLEALADFFNTEKFNESGSEVIVVNDGGRDNGVPIVQEKIKKYPFIKLINREENRGKGFTVRQGLKIAAGNFIFYTDADLPYLTAPIKKMLDILKNGRADLVLVNRDLSAEHNKKPSFARQITHIIYSLFVRSLTKLPFSDTLAGLKGMSSKTVRLVAPKLTIDRFSFDAELLFVAQKSGLKIKEVPVSLENVGKSNLKITKDAPQMAMEVLKIWYRNKQGGYD